MKRFKDLLQELTLQQRRAASRVAKKKSKITAIKRKKSMKKPPTPDKIEKAVDKAVRKRAIDFVDKKGKYSTASATVKTNIEKKADIKSDKFSSKWEKQMKPIIKKKMKDDFKQRKLDTKEK